LEGEGGGLREVGEVRKALSGIEFGDSLREKGEQREPYPNSKLYALFFFFLVDFLFGGNWVSREEAE